MEKIQLKEVLSDDFWIMPATPKYIETGIPYITSKNIKDGKINFENTKFISKDDFEKISKNRPIQKNDILISMIGTLGEIAVVSENDDIFYGQNMFLVRLNENKISQRYFINFFKSNSVKNQLMIKQNKSTQSYLKANHIEELLLPIPPLDIQIKIANKLDKVQEIINTKKIQIKELDSLIKSQFVEMFADTKKCKLSELSIITMGQSPDSSSYNDKQDGLPFFQGKADFGETYVNINHYCNKPTKIAEEDDVLISVRAPVGDVNITKSKCCIGRGLASIRAIQNKSTTWFLYHSLKAMHQEIEMKGTGSTFKAIGKDILYNLEIPCAKIDEQNRFVEFANHIDKLEFVKIMKRDSATRLEYVEKFV